MLCSQHGYTCSGCRIDRPDTNVTPFCKHLILIYFDLNFSIDATNCLHDSFYTSFLVFKPPCNDVVPLGSIKNKGNSLLVQNQMSESLAFSAFNNVFSN